MCDYEGYHFGANYPDGGCADGYLYDLDGDGPSSNDTQPCPKCNTAEYLRDWKQDCQEELESRGFSAAEIWGHVIKKVLALNPEATLKTLVELGPFTLADWATKHPANTPRDPDDDEFVQVQWPWAIPDLSAHENLHIIGSLSAGTQDAT